MLLFPLEAEIFFFFFFTLTSSHYARNFSVEFVFKCNAKRDQASEKNESNSKQ